MVQKRKLLHWEGSSKKDFKEFPIDVQKDMGVALFVVQLGGTPDSAKPWKGLGSGVYELVEDHRATPSARSIPCGSATRCMCSMRSRRNPSPASHAAAGRGVDREAAESSARPLRGERENLMTRIDHSEGTDNVLLDLGFEDAEELSAKAALALKLNELIDQRSLSQTEAAAITGMTQPKVSQVRRYKLQNISLERLMQALVSLDQHVEIVVRPARNTHAHGITVAA